MVKEVIQYSLAPFPCVVLQHPLITREKQSGSLFLPTAGAQPQADKMSANGYHVLIILYVPGAVMNTSRIASLNSNDELGGRNYRYLLFRDQETEAQRD